MLANVASNNDPTYNIFSIELICRPSMPDNNQRTFSDEQQIMDFIQSELTIEGSWINDKKHGALLQASVLKGNPKLRDSFSMNIIKMENLFDLQDTFIKTTSNPPWKYEAIKEDTKYLLQRLQNIYPSPKLLVKMKLNKLLVGRIIVSIHAQKGRVVGLKSARC